MAIRVNALVAPQFNLPINTLTQLDTTTAGGTYAWTLLFKPAGATATLSSTVIQNPTITPDVAGTYLLRCIIDGTTEEYAIFSVLMPRTRQRIPAAGEGASSLGGAVAGTNSWAADVNAMFSWLDRHIERGGIIVCHNNSGGALNKGDVVRVSGVYTLHAGLPGEQIIPAVQNASALATASLGMVGVVLGLSGHSSTTSPAGDLVAVQFRGVVAGIDTVAFAAGTPVYVADGAGLYATSPGTVAYRLGRVLVSHAVTGAMLVDPFPHTIEEMENTPNSLAGHPGKVLVVNSGATALELKKAGDYSRMQAPTFVVATKDSGDDYIHSSANTYLHENNAVLGNPPVTDGFANAVNAAAAAGGGIIWVRRGYYETNAALDINGPVKVIGEGSGSTAVGFLNAASATPVLRLSGAGAELDGLTLVPPPAVAPATVTSFLEVTGTDNRLGDLEIDGAAGSQFTVATLYLNGATRVRLTEVDVDISLNAGASDAIAVAGCAGYDFCKVRSWADIASGYRPLVVNTSSGGKVTRCSFETAVGSLAYGVNITLDTGEKIEFYRNYVYGSGVFVTNAAAGIPAASCIDDNEIVFDAAPGLVVVGGVGGGEFQNCSFSRNKVRPYDPAATATIAIQFEVGGPSNKYDQNQVRMPNGWNGTTGIKFLDVPGGTANGMDILCEGDSQVGVDVDGSIALPFAGSMVQNQGAATATVGFKVDGAGQAGCNWAGVDIYFPVGNNNVGVWFSSVGVGVRNVLSAIHAEIAGAASTGINANGTSGIISACNIGMSGGGTPLANTGSMTVGTNRTAFP